MDITKTRKPHVILAFLAGFLGFGLGYVYVGKLRLGAIIFAAFCSTIGFLAWTRLIVQSATMLWLLAALLVLIALIALIHPIVIAARNDEVPTKRYNHWWFYLVWSLGAVLAGPAIYFSRATILGYETFRASSSAMSPSLEMGELFVSDSWRYHNHAVTVGEIVVFERPENAGVKYIKRLELPKRSLAAGFCLLPLPLLNCPSDRANLCRQEESSTVELAVRSITETVILFCRHYGQIRRPISEAPAITLCDDAPKFASLLGVSRDRFVGFEVPVALDGEAEFAADRATGTNGL
jgi:signal peptidase I